MFAYTILTTGWINYIENYAPLIFCRAPSELSANRGHVLPYEDSVAVVVEAAQYYLNNASSCSDPSILLAK